MSTAPHEHVRCSCGNRVTQFVDGAVKVRTNRLFTLRKSTDGIACELLCNRCGEPVVVPLDTLANRVPDPDPRPGRGKIRVYLPGAAAEKPR